MKALALWLLVVPAAFAQREPHIGYVYPAGGRQGSTFQITVGGQSLNDVTNAFVTGHGVQAKVIDHTKPPTPKEAGMLRDRLKELRDKQNDPEAKKEIAEIVHKLATFVMKPSSPAIADTVIAEITVAHDAPVGERELRLRTATGLSNPLVFCVGQMPEFSRKSAIAIDDIQMPADLPKKRRQQPRATPPSPDVNITLPAVLNGQIMPGAVDRFRFTAHKGQRLVIAVQARALIPYLADAVPGWFQAAVALYDAQGKELAYDDHFRFHPDPVLFYEMPADSEYVLEIHDSIYRGREDFVYRVAIGEFPFVTSVFPLGRRAGDQTSIDLRGWNLTGARFATDISTNCGTFLLQVRNQQWISNEVLYDVDSLPELVDPTGTIKLPVIINGRIEHPGDGRVFQFEGHAGEEVVAEVTARRLDSPLDSMLRLLDATGKQVAFNDDHEDKGSGLNTHHADSYLRVTLPADGLYFLHLTDAQRNGGTAYAYRLRISAPRPDFALRVVPSSVSARAGNSVPLTIFVLRRDGCTNEIKVTLKNAPEGFKLTGGVLTGTQEQARVTLKAPAQAAEEPVALRLEGCAEINGQPVIHPAVPADDMMQAFIYRHLVPARELEVAITERRRP